MVASYVMAACTAILYASGHTLRERSITRVHGMCACYQSFGPRVLTYGCCPSLVHGGGRAHLVHTLQ